jgi:hypothetical protein
VKTCVPTTFTGRKRWEMASWRLVCRAFERHGFQVAALALECGRAFPEVEPLLLQANAPPLLLMVICMPDGFAFNPEKRIGYLFEIKSPTQGRQTVAIRLRDLLALHLWEALIVIVAEHEIRAALAKEMPPPKHIIVPREPQNPWDGGALEWALERFPDIEPLVGVEVAFGSKAPFGLWELKAFALPEHFWGGER